MSLQELLAGEKKLQNIKVKVLKNVGESTIVGDTSGLAICSATNKDFESMSEGQCYIILKPLKLDDNSFVPNEKFKPVKTANFVVKYDKSQLAHLHTLLKTKPETETPVEKDKVQAKLLTFKDLKVMPPKTDIKSITVKIVSISKDIAGSYGRYNIGKVKDIDCQTMDMNIYNRKVRQDMQVGDIFELRNVVVTEYTKDDETIQRLATTSRSSGKKAPPQLEDIFKNVPLGDRREKGEVVAVHEIFTYPSCSKCWKKTKEEDMICSCGNNQDIHVPDFHCQLYVQLAKNEDIEVIHTFRRQIIDVNTLNQDEVQKAVESHLLKKTLTFEWNIIEEEDKLRMLSILH